MADMLVQIWLWIADSFEKRPLAAIACAVLFAGLTAVAIAVLGH